MGLLAIAEPVCLIAASDLGQLVVSRKDPPAIDHTKQQYVCLGRSPKTNSHSSPPALLDEVSRVLCTIRGEHIQQCLPEHDTVQLKRCMSDDNAQMSGGVRPSQKPSKLTSRSQTIGCQLTPQIYVRCEI